MRRWISVQKKFFLPTAILGLALLTTACAPNATNQGTDRTGVTRTGYTGPNTVATRYYSGTTMNRYATNRTGVMGTNVTGTNQPPGYTGYTGYNGYNGYGPGYAGYGPGYTGVGYPYGTGTYTPGLTGPGGLNYTGYNRYVTPGMTGYDQALNGAQNVNPNYRPANLNADADRMANLAATVRGVDSAKSIIIGRTAYVGLDIAENLPLRSAPAIESEVYRLLSASMPGYDIRVTSDKGFVQRIGFLDMGLRNNGYDYTRYRTDVDHLNRGIPARNTAPAAPTR